MGGEVGTMNPIRKQFVVDEENRPVAVQIDLETFEQIEEVLENYALVQLMNEDPDETLGLEAARVYYAGLDKAP